MRFELGYFKTKVAQKIVLLFFVCALLPASTLAFIAYGQVERELRQQQRTRLSTGISAAAVVLIERLQSIQAEIDLLAEEVRGGRSEFALDDLRRLTDITVVTDTETRRIIGNLTGVPTLTDDVLESLGPEDAVLRTMPVAGSGRRDILMAVPLNRDDPALGMLWARAHLDSIFSAAQVYATYRGSQEMDEQVDVGFCALDPERSPLICTGGLAPWMDRNPPAAVQTAPDSTRGGTLLRWTEAGVAFSGSFRRPFLREHFHSDSWILLVAESDRLVLGPLGEFKITFFKGMLLTLLFVLLLAENTVRRSLEPLAQLKKGTASIAARDFEARVRIASGDEFEDLADSFNYMAERVGDLVGELEELNWGTITTLARTIDTKSPWTAGHSERVAQMSLSIARVLGFDQADLDTIHRGGLLHDIGKIGVPSHILDKSTRLDEEEVRIMRDHVMVGARILEPLTPLADVIPMVLQHHERFDGSGYPKGLKGVEIHRFARVMGIADAFDAMQSDRPYRVGRTREESAAVIEAASGIEFDPEMVEAFLKVIALDEKPAAGREQQPLRAGAVGLGEQA